VRVAALYDIHGNLPALEAVLAEVDAVGCDLVLIGGDAALGPMPRATLERLARLGERARWIRGNCDRDMAAPPEPSVPPKPWHDRLRWAAQQLTPAQRERLAGLPLTTTLAIEGLGRVLFCHATPRSDEEIVTRLTPEARLATLLAGVEADAVVSGHTHVQCDRRIGARRWINAGSVGMPFEGAPGAYWALLGPGVELKRTPYDVRAAAAAVRASGFPNADAFAEKELLNPDTAAEASERFEQWSHGQTELSAASQAGAAR